jgi:hypothetical protein
MRREAPHLLSGFWFVLVQVATAIKSALGFAAPYATPKLILRYD